MTHEHLALWITGAPRIDKIEMPHAKSGQLGGPVVRRRSVRSPESLSHEALAHCLLVGLALESEDDARCWEELHGIL